MPVTKAMISPFVPFLNNKSPAGFPATNLFSAVPIKNATSQVPYQRANDLIHGRRSMSPSTALRLAAFFGNSAGF